MSFDSEVRVGRAARLGELRNRDTSVNILPGMVSHYWWQGALERGEEAVMIVKTRASLAEQVRAAVKAGHSYMTPSILVLAVEGGDPDYLGWIMAETEAGRIVSSE